MNRVILLHDDTTNSSAVNEAGEAVRGKTAEEGQILFRFHRSAVLLASFSFLIC
jgi:hypothetical protein